MACDEMTAQGLKAAGQRLTPIRLSVLGALRHACRHMTPAEVIDQAMQAYPHVTPSTVYRALSTLRDVGLIKETRRGGDTQYEWLEEPHHHLTCRSCHDEVSVPHASFASAERKIEADSGYRIDLSHVSLTGLCPECLAESGEK